MNYSLLTKKAARQLQSHTKRGDRPAHGTCDPSGFGKVLSPGASPSHRPHGPADPSPSRPAATGEAGPYLCSLDLLVSAGGGDVAEQQVVREENGKGKTNECGARAGKKGTGLGRGDAW